MLVLLDCLLSSNDLWTCLSTSGPTVCLQTCCVSLKCDPPDYPFLFPAATVLSLFSFSECLVKLHNPDVKPLFSTSSLSLSLRSLCLCSALCFISLAPSLPLFIIPSSRFYSCFCSQRRECTSGGTAFVCTCSMYSHTSDYDCRDTSFLQSLCSDGSREMIQNWAPVDQRRLM